MTTYYDVFELGAKKFLGRMPMETLSRHYMLQREAEARVAREAGQDKGCSLYFSRGDTRDVVVYEVIKGWRPAYYGYDDFQEAGQPAPQTVAKDHV